MWALQSLTHEYKGVLNFTLDGIEVPTTNPPLSKAEFEKLPENTKSGILLKSIELGNGKIPLAITRNKKLLGKK
jgi:hypothetical protein